MEAEKSARNGGGKSFRNGSGRSLGICAAVFGYRRIFCRRDCFSFRCYARVMVVILDESFPQLLSWKIAVRKMSFGFLDTKRSLVVVTVILFATRRLTIVMLDEGLRQLLNVFLFEKVFG